MTSVRPQARSLGELAAHVGGELLGDPSVPITGISGLPDAAPGELSFFASARYRDAYLQTKASAVLVGRDEPARGDRALVRVDQPHLAFARVSQLFHPARQHAAGIRPGAFVHPDARVDPLAAVMPGATVEARGQVGPGTVLYPGAYVGEGASVGAGCTLFPNAAVLERCVVGNRCILHAGCVVGADGFGFALDLSVPEHVKIPQVGTVRVEDDVELGACTTVDRATTGETVIGRGTKIDNLVQVAHNVRVGPLSLICAQVGIAGSAELGTGVVLGGQVGVAGHLRVGDLVKVGGQSGVTQSVEDGAVVSGTPAVPHGEWLRAAVLFKQLPELVREVRTLKKKLEALEAQEG
ncbi:MAG: hypothetical protein RL653_2623 [Pseudomonadota bacterium]